MDNLRLERQCRGDFDFLVVQLESVGIETTFDKVALIPGQRLWEQIASRINEPILDGWAILLTQASIESEACKEELAYALDRALQSKGQSFPMLGLIHQVSIEEIPASLRIRLLVDLRDSAWPQRVLAGLKRTPPNKSATQAIPIRYSWQTIPDFRGPGSMAVRVGPRFGDLRHWRIVLPQGTKIIDWGYGAPQNEGFTGIKTMMTQGAEGTLQVGQAEPESVTWLGSGDLITLGGPAYVVLGPPRPKFIAFGTASEAFGPPLPESLEIMQLR